MSKSIMQTKIECYKTHDTHSLHKHHVMNGVGVRPKSEKYGLWVYLRNDVHEWLHNTSDGQKYAQELKREAQKAFENIHGHEKWMEVFRKNYL